MKDPIHQDPHDETACCGLQTPRGRGAVAVVGVRGNRVGARLDTLFQPLGSRPLSALADRQLIYGSWKSTGEDLVVARIPGDPDGPSTAEHFEIQCHGGETAARAIMDSLADSGVACLSTREFRQREIGFWRAETEDALEQAPTRKSARSILRLMDGEPTWIHSVQQMLQDVDQNRFPRRQALEYVQSMLHWSDFGTWLTQPRSIVFSGRPNVGKSSLMNRLAGFERSIVDAQAGTTRDVVRHRTAIDGWPVELRDTAGLRMSTHPVESRGVERARSQLATADVTVAVFDASEPWTDEDQATLATLNRPMVVFNKLDRRPPEASVPNRDPSPRPEGIFVSATRGDHLDELLSKIAAALFLPEPDGQQAFPVTRAQRERLECLVRALQATDQPAAPLVADWSPCRT